MKRLPGYPSCYACGRENAHGFRLELHREGRRVLASHLFPERYAGFPGVVHGGVIATFLDEVMAWAAIEASGTPCVTGEMKVRYLRPAPVGEILSAWGEPIEEKKRFILCRGSVSDSRGTELAKGEARFFPAPTYPLAT